MATIEHHVFNPDTEEFQPPFWLFSKHMETIFPSILRKAPKITLRRERLELDDGDFLDLDWHEKDHNKLVILSHGLEGSSRRPYMLGMVKSLGENGFDSLAWNCRSCSEEINRLPRLYHHADFEDLDKVIEYGASNGYKEIFLLGFSMGGNLTLHWLYEYPEKAISLIGKAIVISAPIDLKSSAEQLMKPQNFVYKKRFLSRLKEKIKAKALQFPEIFNREPLEKINSFYSLDQHYTAPIHGFNSADDFYQKGSTRHKLPFIKTPTLLIQAKNDPFFTKSCYPAPRDIGNPNINLHYPKRGGHVGFTIAHNQKYFSEELSVKFLKS
jgi:uncharacterized protein